MRSAFLVMALVVAAMLPRVGFLARPFESDAGLYVYMGKVVAEGGAVYRDFYETKPPGVALFCAGVYRVFGDAWWAYVALQAGMVLASAWMISRCVEERGTTAAFVCAIVMLNVGPVAYRGFQLETVQAFFASLAGYFAVRALEGKSGALWVGVFAGCAAMLKPTGAAVAGALVLAGAWRAAPMVALGAMIPTGAAMAWTWRAGLMGEMPGLWREISRYGSGTPVGVEEGVKWAMVAIVVILPFLICRVASANDGEKHGQALKACHMPPQLKFAVIWLGLECVGVFVQKRMYAYHFLVLAPAVALLFGQMCAGMSVRRYAVAFAPVIVLSLVWSAKDLRDIVPKRLPESNWLLVHAQAGDRVAGDGIERLLMETGLSCGTRFAHLFYLANHDDAPRQFGAAYLEDLRRNRPRWVVMSARRVEHRKMQAVELPMFARNAERARAFLEVSEAIDRHVDANYRPTAQVAGKTIYELR